MAFFWLKIFRWTVFFFFSHFKETMLPNNFSIKWGDWILTTNDSIQLKKNSKKKNYFQLKKLKRWSTRHQQHTRLFQFYFFLKTRLKTFENKSWLIVQSFVKELQNLFNIRKCLVWSSLVDIKYGIQLVSFHLKVIIWKYFDFF